MKVLDVLKVVPHDQSTIIDVYENGHLKYCSIMDYAETAGDVLLKMRADILGLEVTEISAKKWEDPLDKKEKITLSIVSDN